MHETEKVLSVNRSSRFTKKVRNRESISIPSIKQGRVAGTR